MGDSDPTPSCLSAESHRSRDSTLHYLGCHEFWERPEYIESLKPEEMNRINSELRRFIYLRKALKNEKDESVSNLVGNLEGSMAAWRDSRGNHGIKAVRQWRRGRGLPNGVSQDFPEEEKGSATYDPDSDVKAFLVSYKDGNHVRNAEDHGHSHDHKMIASQRKILVSQLLTQHATGDSSNASDSLLAELSQASDGSINYLHLPANNMAWIERAVELYYGEQGHNHGHGEKTRAQMLLGPQFWRGQQHVGKSAELHARHLRSLCEMVPSDPSEVDASPENMVLFMPYLHWETDRQRENITRFLDQEEGKQRKKGETGELRRKQNRQLERMDLPRPSAKKEDIAPPKISRTKYILGMGPNSPGIYKTLTQVASAVQSKPHSWRSRHPALFKNDKNGRILADKNKPAGPLGQVLIDAARLYEAIVTYRDKMLIRKYLYNDPPLHPRRTLDQAYYSTLKTTKARDRDQVVYRGTRPDPPHTIDMKTRNWTCSDEGTDGKDQHTENVQAQKPGRKDQRTADTQEQKTERKDQFCVHCANHVRKVSRILMVDQLWLWILDDKTIITAFPKRYGLNKQDPSGMHKSIRVRLQNLRPGHIKTVFDLALIILDELTNMFFDRTKTTAEQPEVLNIFSETIGIINNRQTLGYQHLWDWTRDLAKVASPGALPADLSEFVAPLLNISTEGALQREIKDVLDELSIILYLQKQQLVVIESFVGHAKSFLDPKDQPELSLAASPTSLNSPGSPISGVSNRPITDKDLEIRKKNLAWFTRMSDNLLASVKGRIGEIEALKQSAESVSSSVENLLALKQQQASVVQAWQSVQQAEEAVRQGRAIMVFTLITIIFLPLAFMSSIFGMNNEEFSGPGAPMRLQQQFKLMFPISVGIVVVVLVFAYSGFVRTIVWLAYRYLIIFTLVKTSLYDRVYLSLDWKSASLTRKVEEKVRDMKLLVKKNKQKRTFNEIQERREKQRIVEVEEEKSQKEEERKKRMAPYENGRDGGASDGSHKPGAPSVTPTIIATPPAKNPRVHFIDSQPHHSHRAGTEPSGQMHDLEAQSGEASSTPRRTLLQVPRTTSLGVQTTPSLIPPEGEWPGMLRSERVRRTTESFD